MIGFRGSLYMVFGQTYMLNFLLLVSSLLFNFCYWHRILIYSMTLVLFLETLQRLGIIISEYAYVSAILTIFAIILSSILYYKNGCYKKKEISRDIA